MTGESGLRRILLAIVGVGTLGLAAELLLLEHYEEWTQWLPLAVLGVVLVAVTALWVRPTPGVVRAFRAVMVVVTLTGLAGLVLHFAGNRAFELEMDARTRGWMLVWHALRGATPALAPGALIQLGLLGIALTWRHPALSNENQSTE